MVYIRLDSLDAQNEKRVQQELIYDAIITTGLNLVGFLNLEVHIFRENGIYGLCLNSEITVLKHRLI